MSRFFYDLKPKRYSVLQKISTFTKKTTHGIK